MPSKGDVLVLVIGQFYELVTLYPAAVTFGRDRNFTHLYVNAICHALGKVQVLACFHVFTSCKGTIMACETWNAYLEMAEVFIYMAPNPYSNLDFESTFRTLHRCPL